MKALLALLALLAATPVDAAPVPSPIVIAHRGASGERPEHTLAAYERAIDHGADWIEPDLVPTKDGVLVARHENEIGGTTDVADRPEFADRRSTKVIDGEEVTGWFTEDFTLAELRTLRARERLSDLRPANTLFDGLYTIPTLDEIVALLRAKEAETGRRVGLIPEIKHPGYFAAQGYDLASMLLERLDASGFGAQDPVAIQSFELRPLCELSARTEIPLVFLASARGSPADLPQVTYEQMLQPAALPAIARCADMLGVEIRLLLQADGSASPIMQGAKAAGLPVHAWTLRAENAFLPEALQRGDDPAAHGDAGALAAMLFDAGVAGLFADQPALAVAARDLWLAGRQARRAARM